MNNTLTPASERQISFLNSLLAERENTLVVEFAGLTSKQASEFIGTLINAPKRVAGVRADFPVLEGMYRNNAGVI